MREIEEHGFGIVEPVFGSDEVEQLLNELALSPLLRTRAGARCVLRNPSVAALANDSRLVQLAREALGATAVPFRATLFDKSASANWLVVWHQDTALPVRQQREAPGWGPWSRKAGIVHAHAPEKVLGHVLALRIHLDASTSWNGPLRVLPGSHLHGLLTDDQVRQIASAARPVECLVSRGGVLAMRPLLVHSSSKSRDGAPRRVLHIEYAASMHLGDGLELAVA